MMFEKPVWNAPPVLVIGGGHEFFRSRKFRETIREASAAGRQIEHVAEGDALGLSRLLGMSVLSAEPQLLVLGSKTEFDPDVLIQHYKEKDSTTVILLHVEGDLPTGAKNPVTKVVAALNKRHVAEYPKTSDFKKNEEAVAFVVAEAKRLGKTLPEALATTLVSAVGPELGQLSFEVLKVSVLLDSMNPVPTEVLPEHIRGTLSLLGDVQIGPVVDALAVRNERAVLRTLSAVKRASPTDATIRVIGWLGKTLPRWLHAAALMHAGVQDVAGRMGVNSFYFDKSIAPPARLWGQNRLVKMIKDVAHIERAAKSGEIDPWAQLECTLAKACRDGVAR